MLWLPGLARLDPTAAGVGVGRLLGAGHGRDADYLLIPSARGDQFLFFRWLGVPQGGGATDSRPVVKRCSPAN